jgi:hypothetical protein
MIKLKVALILVLIFPPAHVFCLITVGPKECYIGILKRESIWTYNATHNSASRKGINVLLVARAFGNSDRRLRLAQDGLRELKIRWQCGLDVLGVGRKSIEPIYAPRVRLG